MTRQKHLGGFVIAVGLLVIAAATLTPLPLTEYRSAGTPFWCLVCGSLGSVDVILNVALFLPLGVGLERMGWRVTRIAIACFLTSLAVESLQIMTIAGRDASVSDLITNTSGGMLGGFIAQHWRGLVFPSPRHAGRLFLGGMVAVLAVFLFTATLLQPDLPAGPWYGIVTPAWSGHEVFGGTVVDARLGDQPLSGNGLPQAADHRTALLSGEPILVRFVVGQGTLGGVAPIAALTTSDNRSLAILAQRGNDVTVGVRLRASSWRLRTPKIRLGRVIPNRPGATVVAWGGIGSGQLYAGAVVKDRWKSRRLPLSIALGWALLLPVGWGLGPETQALSGLWLVALIAPLAYWAVLSQWRLALLGVGALMLSVLALLPPACALRHAHWSEWLAAAIAIALGAAAAQHACKRTGEWK